MAMEFTVTEQLPIYHIKSVGDVFKASSAAATLSKDLDKPFQLCWSGTLVTVKPEMDGEQVVNQWSADRADYQRNMGSPHKALCPVCLKNG